MELSNRLATAQLTMGGETAGAAAAGGDRESGGQRGGRGGGRGGRGGGRQQHGNQQDRSNTEEIRA